MTYNVCGGTLNLAQSIQRFPNEECVKERYTHIIVRPSEQSTERLFYNCYVQHDHTIHSALNLFFGYCT